MNIIQINLISLEYHGRIVALTWCLQNHFKTKKISERTKFNESEDWMEWIRLQDQPIPYNNTSIALQPREVIGSRYS